MNRNSNKKRKNRNSSDNDSVGMNKEKIQKQRGPSADSDCDISVSEILTQTNTLLYGEGGDTNDTDLGIEVLFSDSESKMADGKDKGKDKGTLSKTNSAEQEPSSVTEPTNRDIMNCLLNICGRIEVVEKKLCVIEQLEKKIDNFERELKGIRVTMQEQTKHVDERISNVEEKVDAADMSTVLITSRVEIIEKERESLKEEIAYLKSQTMRNNLIFTGISEIGENESPHQTEEKLRCHLVDVMKLCEEFAQSFKLERVHMSPSEPIRGKIRSIVAKFTFFKDRETVRKQWKELNGTNFNVFEQFPPEVVNKRRKLVPRMKEARRQCKRSWIVYDTLYVDGKAVKE